MTRETRKGSSRVDARPEASEGRSALGLLVRRHDRDRYQTALFAPADRREALFALYAFNYEIARVRESVTQPMLGQIRLQWWREIVAAAFEGGPPRAHYVAGPLAAVITSFGLTRGHFDRMIDTREEDLADASRKLQALAGTSPAGHNKDIFRDNRRKNAPERAGRLWPEARRGSGLVAGDRGGDRTRGPRIKSALLYH